MLGAAADDLNVYEMIPRAEIGREIAKRNSFTQRSVFGNFNFKNCKIDIFFILWKSFIKLSPGSAQLVSITKYIEI